MTYRSVVYLCICHSLNFIDHTSEYKIFIAEHFVINLDSFLILVANLIFFVLSFNQLSHKKNQFVQFCCFQCLFQLQVLLDFAHDWHE